MTEYFPCCIIEVSKPQCGLGKKVISMSFKENAYQQMSFIDSFSGLTAREQKALEKSWAKVFADEIFPAIDEKRFSVLYSDKAYNMNFSRCYRKK